MREKLIELLQTSPMDIMGNHPVGSIADWLIANGVTIPVRCKDCKHYVWDDWDCCHVCVHLSKYVKEDFGCLGGERRTDE